MTHGSSSPWAMTRSASERAVMAELRSRRRGHVETCQASPVQVAVAMTSLFTVAVIVVSVISRAMETSPPCCEGGSQGSHLGSQCHSDQADGARLSRTVPLDPFPCFRR